MGTFERTPLLTASRVAAEIGVSTETILRWTRAGKLPGIKLPSGQIRYRPETIDRWLDGEFDHGAN